MPDYVITAQDNPELFKHITFKGSATAFSIDFNPWSDDNHDVSSVTWSVEAGQASVSGASLTSNVASALITTSEAGGSLIKALADTGTEKYVVFIEILSKGPAVITSNDYGLYL